MCFIFCKCQPEQFLKGHSAHVWSTTATQTYSLSLEEFIQLCDPGQTVRVWNTTTTRIHPVLRQGQSMNALTTLNAQYEPLSSPGQSLGDWTNTGGQFSQEVPVVASTVVEFDHKTTRLASVYQPSSAHRPQVSRNHNAFDTLTRNSHASTGDHQFSCPFDDCSCTCNGDIKEHIDPHAPSLTYSCLLCEYRSTKRSNMRAHYRCHTGERPYQCHLCQRKFSCKGNFDKHNRTHHRDHPL